MEGSAVQDADMGGSSHVAAPGAMEGNAVQDASVGGCGHAAAQEAMGGGHEVHNAAMCGCGDAAAHEAAPEVMEGAAPNAAMCGCGRCRYAASQEDMRQNYRKYIQAILRSVKSSETPCTHSDNVSLEGLKGLPRISVKGIGHLALPICYQQEGAFLLACL
jgi:hypothetical protein